jgi:hypothetical protein
MMMNFKENYFAYFLLRYDLHIILINEALFNYM